MLIDLGYGEQERHTMAEINPAEANVFQLEGPIDILTYVHRDFDFDDCLKRAFIFHYADGTIPVMGLTDLRELKVRVRRNQDLRDVLAIDEFLLAKGQDQTKKET